METNELTAERGSNYGRAFDHFSTTEEMMEVWSRRREDSSTALDPKLERCLKHIVSFCIDKMVRAAENPLHLDDFDDVAGYASLWRGCVADCGVASYNEEELNEAIQKGTKKWQGVDIYRDGDSAPKYIGFRICPICGIPFPSGSDIATCSAECRLKYIGR